MKKFYMFFYMISILSLLMISSCGKNDIDSMLDQYENIMDDYVKIAKKFQSGDMSAMKDLESLKNKAEDLKNKLDKVKDSGSGFTEAQKDRYIKITQKALESMK